jgi:RNA polymerase sigma-70 factor, ECF subfamily
VLSFPASEAAQILGTTAVSVNSSLQRARTRVKEAGAGPEPLREPSAAGQRAWVDRYMKAFERVDVEGLKRLLTEDVLMEMPPMLNWFTGRRNYGLFMEWVFGVCGTDWRLTTVGANGQPGFAAYLRAGGRYEPHTLQISPSPPRASAAIRCFRVPGSSRPSACRPDSTPGDRRPAEFACHRASTTGSMRSHDD